MNSSFLIALVSTSLSACAFLPLRAEELSQEETIAYLREKLQVAANFREVGNFQGRFIVTNTFEIRNLDKVGMTWFQRTRQGDLTDTRTTTLKWKNLDPRKITANGSDISKAAYVRLEGSTGTPIHLVHITQYEGREAKKSTKGVPWCELTLNGEDAANRVARAIQHLVRIAGGREEPFGR